MPPNKRVEKRHQRQLKLTLLCSRAQTREGPGLPHFRLVLLGGHSTRMGLWARQSCGHSASPCAHFSMVWCHRLFDLMSGMCKLEFHPLSLPVLRFWLQEEAVMVRTAPGDVVSCCLPATSWVRARATGHCLWPNIPRRCCDSTPEQTKTKLLPLGFPNASPAPWRCKLCAEEAEEELGCCDTQQMSDMSWLLTLQCCSWWAFCTLVCLLFIAQCLAWQLS